MRFYRALLYVYPSSFRSEYGDEMAASFNARWGGHGFAAKFFAAIADIVPNAAAVHWDMLRQDLHYALRALRRAPAFALTAIFVLAIGVGANTAAFSIADFVLFRPLPFPQPDRLATLWATSPGYTRMELSPANYRDWKSSNRSFAGMAAFSGTAMNLVGANEPVRLEGQRVTSDLFGVLGVAPLIGRTFTDSGSDDQSVVLSYELWQRQFGGDPRITGRQITLDGQPSVVIGVMPRGFHFPTHEAQLWTMVRFQEADYQDRNDNYIHVVGRLKESLSLEQAKSDIAVIAARLERQYPKENDKVGSAVYRLGDDFSPRAKMMLLSLCGAALCILLLACANLGNLLLARAVGREREIAVRAAIGGGRARLVRQLVTESVLLAALGGAAGLMVAYAALPVLARLIPDTLPTSDTPSLNMRVLIFAAALISFTGIAFGVVPALRACGAAGMRALRDGMRTMGGRRQRVRAALIVVEVAASVVLLIASGLLVRAMWRVQSIDPGFATENILTMRTALPQPKYESNVRREQYYNRVLSEVRAIPGVTSAAFISFVPIEMGGGIWPAAVSGEPIVRDSRHTVSLRFTTPGFFSTLKIPLLKGRDVEDTDKVEGLPVAVVSQSFAERHWPSQDPIGRTFQVAFSDRTIVGVVRDIRVRGLERQSEPQVYLPYSQQKDANFIFYIPKDLVIRSSMPTATLLPTVRQIVFRADPEQPISNVKTMSEILAGETASRSAQIRVLGVLAAIALLLASVGIHGLLAFTVSSRSQEIGVRRALGAQSNEILKMVMQSGIRLAMAGVIPGVVVAYAAGRAMHALLVGVHPADPLTLVAAIALCSLTTILGSLGPALRASRVDPILAMRAD